MTPITPVSPAPTRLAGGLEAAAEAVALAVASAEDAGEGAKAFSRIAVTAASKEAVDRLAARWGVPARWSADGTIYVARKYLGGTAAEVEALYYAPAVSEAAA